MRGCRGSERCAGGRLGVDAPVARPAACPGRPSRQGLCRRPAVAAPQADLSGATQHGTGLREARPARLTRAAVWAEDLLRPLGLQTPGTGSIFECRQPTPVRIGRRKAQSHFFCGGGAGCPNCRSPPLRSSSAAHSPRSTAGCSSSTSICGSRIGSCSCSTFTSRSALHPARHGFPTSAHARRSSYAFQAHEGVQLAQNRKNDRD